MIKARCIEVWSNDLDIDEMPLHRFSHVMELDGGLSRVEPRRGGPLACPEPHLRAESQYLNRTVATLRRHFGAYL
jgi:hypothetical protein